MRAARDRVSDVDARRDSLLLLALLRARDAWGSRFCPLASTSTLSKGLADTPVLTRSRFLALVLHTSAARSGGGTHRQSPAAIRRRHRAKTATTVGGERARNTRRARKAASTRYGALHFLFCGSHHILQGYTPCAGGGRATPFTSFARCQCGYERLLSICRVRFRV